MYPTIDLKATGIRLRRIMEQKKITVKTVQEYLELSCVQSVYRWLSGRSMPSIDHLYGLSELFQMPIDHMIVGSRISKLFYDRPFIARMAVYYSAVKELRGYEKHNRPF